ncbi:hypothetical protein ACU8KH_00634 [Lachancea thermotolerans]
MNYITHRGFRNYRYVEMGYYSRPSKVGEHVNEEDLHFRK